MYNRDTLFPERNIPGQCKPNTTLQEKLEKNIKLSISV